jgi:hypothetical protein
MDSTNSDYVSTVHKQAQPPSMQAQGGLRMGWAITETQMSRERPAQDPKVQLKPHATQHRSNHLRSSSPATLQCILLLQGHVRMRLLLLH